MRICINEMIYFIKFMSLNAEDLMVAKHIGVTEPCILKIATGQKLKVRLFRQTDSKH